MTDRRANADELAVGRDGLRPTPFVDFRIRRLEADCAELGARLAALEGLVFILQHRVRALEAGLPQSDLTPRCDPPACGAPQPHTLPVRR